MPLLPFLFVSKDSLVHNPGTHLPSDDALFNNRIITTTTTTTQSVGNSLLFRPTLCLQTAHYWIDVDNANNHYIILFFHRFVELLVLPFHLVYLFFFVVFTFFFYFAGEKSTPIT